MPGSVHVPLRINTRSLSFTPTLQKAMKADLEQKLADLKATKSERQKQAKQIDLNFSNAFVWPPSQACVLR